MGRKSQERMTGYTYEERVKRSHNPINRFIKAVRRRLNKPPPTHFANVRRSGEALLNPNLNVKVNDEPRGMVFEGDEKQVLDETKVG